MLEGGWVGWSSYRYMTGDVTGIELVSDNDFFQEVLQTYGLTTNDLLTADQKINIDTGFQNSYFGSLGANFLLHPKFTLLSRGGYSSPAVPIEYLAPANGDFETFQVDLGGIWSATKNLELGSGLIRIFHEESDGVFIFFRFPREEVAISLTASNHQGDF